MGARQTVGRRRAGRRVAVKRVYDEHGSSDGTRVLVDRLWPRGISRERAAADLWLKDVAPSDALRRWFGHDPRRWASFRRKYRAELAQRPDLLEQLDGLRRRGPLTLVYGARDEARNQAVVLRQVLEDRRPARRRRGRPPQREERDGKIDDGREAGRSPEADIPRERPVRGVARAGT
jgi:uncharacterized protein YeaO (DUF488 family)